MFTPCLGARLAGQATTKAQPMVLPRALFHSKREVRRMVFLSKRKKTFVPIVAGTQLGAHVHSTTVTPRRTRASRSLLSDCSHCASLRDVLVFYYSVRWPGACIAEAEPLRFAATHEPAVRLANGWTPRPTSPPDLPFQVRLPAGSYARGIVCVSSTCLLRTEARGPPSPSRAAELSFI